MSSRVSAPQVAIALLIAAFLVAFLVVPVLTVVYVAVTNADGSLTLAHFAAFFADSR